MSELDNYTMCTFNICNRLEIGGKELVSTSFLDNMSSKF